MNRSPFLRPIHVLVVEDDSADTYLIQRALHRSQNYAFDVTMVASRQAAERELMQSEFDLCLCDFWLSTETSLSFVHVLTRHHHMPVILMSGLEGMEIQAEVGAVGPFEFLPKSEITTERLEAVIGSVLADARRPRDRREPPSVGLAKDVVSMAAIGPWLIDMMVRLDNVERSLGLSMIAQDRSETARTDVAEVGKRALSDIGLMRREFMLRLDRMGWLESALSRVSERVDLCSIIDDVVRSFELDAGCRQLNLSFARPDMPIWIKTDAVLLRDLVAVLLMEAIESADTERALTIQLDIHENEVFIILLDGQGMKPPEDVEFVAGSLQPAATISELLLTPLGSCSQLAMRLVAELGGAIDINSFGKDGTTSVFSLPLG